MVYDRGMEYTVKQLAQLAGITTRTLHFYDETGLLKPERVAQNGYRYYGEESVLRLQQILFYRELDIPLEKIRQLLNGDNFEAEAALRKHKKALELRIERSKRLIETIEETILHLQGVIPMNDKNLFSAFSEEEQEEYAKEAERLYDPEIVRASQKKWKSYSDADKKRIGEEGNAAYAALAAAIPHGSGSPEAQAGVELWRKHMDYFWTPNPEQLVGLTELYLQDARFKANFDKIDPRLAEFMHEAVKIYVKTV
jgi:MerR family transcriptional regulator, thiopeptide resistance regulator